MNRGRPWRTCARYFRWQIESRLNKEVEFKWIAGTKLIIRNGMTGATGNVYCGLHEFSDMAFALHLLRPEDLFLDVGANIGSYTILSSGVCGAKTIAFEPDPETSRALRRNIAANGLEGAVTVHELALSDADGETAFTGGKDSMNRVAEPCDGLTRQVRTARLDNIPNASEAAFMKLDVEGFEEHVLAGAAAVLQNGSLIAIASEAQGSTVEETLRRHGFERMHYDPISRSSEPAPFSSSNGLFIRDRDAAQSRISEAQVRNINGVYL